MQAMEQKRCLRAVLFCEKGAYLGLRCIFALRRNKHCATLCLSDGRLMKMLISTKGRYALRVMIDLSEQDRDGYHVLMDIAKRQEISEKYLESIIAILSKAGFVQAQRGRLSVEQRAAELHSRQYFEIDRRSFGAGGLSGRWGKYLQQSGAV